MDIPRLHMRRSHQNTARFLNK